LVQTLEQEKKRSTARESWERHVATCEELDWGRWVSAKKEGRKELH